MQQYRGNLKNPPLLVVTDIDRWIIRTNFTDTVEEKYSFTHAEIPQKLDLLRTMFDDVQVEPLELEALTELERASQLNWAAVNPTIFGTLFERVLDATKRSQLGAHYTGTQDIELVIKPVLMTPLLHEWEATRAAAAPIREKYDATTDPRQQQKHQRDLLTLRDKMLDKVQSTRVLDPACGSGNFLYVALRNLKDLEKKYYL